MQTNLPRPVDEPNDDVNTVPNSTELRRRRRAFFEDGASSPRRSPRLNAGLSAADNSPPLAAVDDTSDVDDDSSAMEGGLVEEDGREPDEAEPETATETGQIADPEPGKVEQEPQGLAEEPIKDNAGPQGTDEDETKLCRICFGGLEEEAELGRLFSPCKCKGSMRYVHVNCLNQWRQRANKKEAFYRCDQCLYKYSFSRTWWAQLVTNELVLTIVTLLLFVVLVFVAGFVSKLLLMAYVYFNPPDEEIPPPADQPPENMEPLDYWDRMLQFDPRNMSLLRFDASHFFAGFFLVGVVGAANVVFQIFLGPFAPMPRFGGVVRVGGGGGGGQDSKFPSLVMLVVVVIGAVRTAYALYKSVKAFSRRGLEVVEASILEVRE